MEDRERERERERERTQQIKMGLTIYFILYIRYEYIAITWLHVEYKTKWFYPTLS